MKLKEFKRTMALVMAVSTLTPSVVYSVCQFQNGKIYNCDLNAAYNIGARYYIREILKSLPAKVRLAIKAKVPQLAKRSTCTLSSIE